MRVESLEALPDARKPAGKVAPACLSPRRDMNRLDEFAVREKYRILPGVLKTVGVVQIAGTLRQKSGVGNVKHLAFGMLELLQRQRRFAAACAADHNQRCGLAIDGILRVVKRNRLVEQVNRRPLRVQITHWLRFLDRLIGLDIGDFALVDRRTAQKARLVVIVIGDHLQHQRTHLVAMANQREQQPVSAIQPGPVKLAVAEIGQLFNLGGPKIQTRNRVRHFAITGLDARNIQTGVFENFHRVCLFAGNRRQAA